MSNAKTDCSEQECRFFQFEVSVVVLTYNSNFDDLKKTLASILSQKDVRLEIIIADDGSENNNEEAINALFSEYSFSDFTLILNEKNAGTVKNYISGLSVAQGEYTKSISPGDYLASEFVLRDWLDFMTKSKFAWSFSDAIYYKSLGAERKIILADARPRYIFPYLKKNINLCRWYYIVFDDIAMGATMLGKTALKLAYCKRLAEKGIILAEDNIFRLMMFDGIYGAYYPKATVFYEYGNGVSTSEETPYKKQLYLDWMLTDEIMSETATDSFQIKMLQEKENLLSPRKKWFVRGKLRMTIYRRILPRKTAGALPER